MVCSKAQVRANTRANTRAHSQAHYQAKLVDTKTRPKRSLSCPSRDAPQSTWYTL